MIDGTIRLKSEERENTTALKPCDAVFVVGIKDGEEAVSCQALTIRDGGPGSKKLVNALAYANVHMLAEIAGTSNMARGIILSAYLKSFIDHAVDRTGAEVMDAAMSALRK